MSARWRSADERARGGVSGASTPEFPDDGPGQDAALSRRGFLGVMGASLALAGELGCARAPAQKIVPYGAQPPEVTPGVPRYYATALTLGGIATGVLVESHEGRPTKIEGNPDHPASLGAAGPFEQAAVLSLYDPDRAKYVTRRGEAATFREFADAFGGTAPDASESLRTGRGLHFVMGPTASPTLIALIRAVRARLPGAQFHFHAAVSRENVWRGTTLAFGRALDPQYDLRAADVVVALDADLLDCGPSGLRHAYDFAARRRLRSSADTMNRLYAVESALSVTGAAADHRARVRRSDVAAVAFALLAEVLRGTAGAPQIAGAGLPHGVSPRWLDAVARDLRAHPGRSLVAAGDGQPPEVHAAVAMINAALGNAGTTVRYVEPAIFEAGLPSHGLRPLADELAAGRVETLVVLDTNVAYSAPADLDFPTRMQRARTRAHLGPYQDETARHCEWFVPASHQLEYWCDARAFDGTASIIQPLVEPLYATKSCAEVLAVFAGRADADGRTLVRSTWQAQARGDFETQWEQWLQKGVVDGTASPTVVVTPREADIVAAVSAVVARPSRPGIEISFREDAKVHDGRFANNAWLQELPDPITKLTWDNAALISPETAARQGLVTGDVVEVRYRGRGLHAAVMIAPGHADDSVSLALGYGRDGEERLARGVGSNAYAIRTSDSPAFDAGITLAKTDETHEFATTQEHWTLEGRDPIPEAKLEDYRRHPDFAAEKNREHESLYHLPLAGENQWGMSIDLAVCTGCSACVVACQAENNVPVVGREGVKMSREMHWLRIDRYFTGDLRDPAMSPQPMLCQHCEQAPCEYVCPVGATVHSPDGLNEQVYNRCVGTRFCSNNCPYKVRRFNWFNYHRDQQPSESLVMNPDVTVRARGVMEKCTYCVQRIREAEIVARREQRAIRDGEVVTACQQTCPTGAIVFGNTNDARSAVRAMRRNERTYAVLDELGTRPRTRYLARVRNPNPELEDS